MFLMSVILWGGLLAGIPILVHLLHRQKTTPIAWGAMQFLMETPLKLKRRQRIDHWLLMLLRIAIVLALVALLARPMVVGGTFSSSTPMDVAIVIDHSLSMGRRGGAEGGGGATFYDEAVKRAEQVAAMMPAGGGGATVSVVLAEHSPRVITPVPVVLGGSNGGEWSRVLQQLREIKPGLTDANIPAAVQAASDLAARGRNVRKLVVVISDDQKSNWAVGNDAAWRLTTAGRGGARDKDSPVLSLPVIGGGAGGANVSVGNVAVQPAFLGVNRPAQVTATVSNTGSGELGSVTLQLIVDGRNVTSQQIGRLGPGQSNTVRMDHFFTEPGSHWLRVKAEVVDGLEADNVATAAVNVSPRLPVLIIDGQRTSAGGGGPLGNYPAAAFLTAAMQPMDALDAGTLVSPKVVSVANLGTVRFEDYPIVVLNDVPRLPGEAVARLAEYTLRGNGLWIILGARTEESFLSGTLAKSPLFPAAVGKVVNVAPDAPPVEIDIKEPENAALALVTAAQRNALAGANVRAWWPVRPGGGGMRTILATSTGDPLALEMDVGKAGGRVVVWTSSVSDVGWNNLPLVPNFVPLVNETLFHLASGQSQSQQRQLEAGGAIVWSGPATPTITAATLIAPDATTRTLQPQLRGDNYVVQYKDTYLPGLYEMRFTPAEIPQPVYFSVGIDRAELDPATVSSGDADWLKSRRYLHERVTLETLPAAMSAQRAGYELWWIVGLLLAGLLIGEVVMTWRLARKQTDVDVEHAGLVKPTRDPAAAVVGGSVR
jgi:hypothetical protein